MDDNSLFDLNNMDFEIMPYEQEEDKKDCCSMTQIRGEL